MNILVTNDDGYKSRGLLCLRNVLSEKHNVFVMAPDSNRSAVSHCINMAKPLDLVKMEENFYTCSGFPADCVINGTVSGIFPKIDLIISGINYGANIGTDIVYSGTCAAARQGALYGIPSVAVSLKHMKGFEAREEEYNFDVMADFIMKNLEDIYKTASSRKHIFVNMNGISCDGYKGMKKVTEISVRDYGDQIKLEKSDKGFKSNFIMGKSKTYGGESSDYSITVDGYVSVAVISAMPVCLEHI